MYSYDPFRKSIEFDYGVSPKHPKKRIFSEVGRHFIDSIFQETEIHLIYFYRSFFNKSSIRSLEKLDFVGEGLIRDYYFMNNNFVDAYLYSKIGRSKI